MTDKKQNIICDCWIGILNSYDQSDLNHLTISNYIQRLNEQSSHSKDMAKLSDQWKAFEPYDYLDRRKSMAILFKYCPKCGTKLNWLKIRRAIRS